MKRMTAMVATLAAAAFGGAALASEAETSATAGRGFFGGSNAGATARYDGQVGFAGSTTHSGKIDLARGVAVGVDRDGLSLSVSNAVAPKFGPAVATNFNISIGRDGDVSRSHGLSIARGPFGREASAGGETRTGGWQGGSSTSFAAGKARLGRVTAETASHSQPARKVVRVVGRR